MPTDSQAADASSGSLDPVVRRIFERLETDIRDRKGLKHEWAAIDDDVMNEELRPAWQRILTEEISTLINAPNGRVSEPPTKTP